MNRFVSKFAGAFFALGAFCVCALLSACVGSKQEVESLLQEPQLQAPQQSDKHFLWKVSDEDSYVWLLGSMHFGDTSFYPMDSVIEEAFYESEELAVEINVSNDAVNEQLSERRSDLGTLPEGVILPQVLPEWMWNSLDSICADWNFPVAQLMKMRPWNAASMLSAVALQRTGIDASLGVDVVLLDRAASEGKRIVEIETVNEQIGALAGDQTPVAEEPSAEEDFVDEDGIYYMRNTLREISMLDSMVSTMMTAWKTGNDSLLNLMLNHKKTDENAEIEGRFEEKIYTKRNVKMVEFVANFLRENRKVFVVVGVAHLALNTGNVDVVGFFRQEKLIS